MIDNTIDNTIDMQTLKVIITEMRNDEDLTFQEISNRLQSDYGVKKTRQAIGGLYNRMVKAKLDNDRTIRTINDIVNIACIVDTATQVLEEVQKLGRDVTYRYVLDTIQSSSEQIERIEGSIVENIRRQIQSGTTIDELESQLAYKGVKISRRKLDKYCEMAYVVEIRNILTKSLASFYKLTSNKDLLKEVNKTFGKQVKLNDVWAII